MSDGRAADASASAAPARDGLTASAVAQLCGGTLHGDADVRIGAVAALERATASELSFCAGTKHAAALSATSAGVVLVTAAVAELPTTARARIVVADPSVALLKIIPALYGQALRFPGVHPTAFIAPGAELGPDAAVGPFAVIGTGAVLRARVTVHAHAVVGPGVTVGDDSEIGPHATVHAGTTIGARVIIRAGARLGNEGFKYVFHDGGHRKVPHVGRCVIEDDVEIGANSCVDRGSIGDTVIGAGTKIDNLVHVAHNVRIGRHSLVIAQVGIAGSVTVGNGVVLAGQVGVSDHHVIGDRAILAAQAGVISDIPAGETWSGYPARPHREQLRATAALHQLAKWIKPLARLLEGKS